MSESNNMGSYMDSIGGAGLAAARAESRRIAQALEDERVREAQDAKRKRDLKSIADHKARQNKADAEKRAKLQEESDAIIAAKVEEEKARAKREYRGAMGTLDGFEDFWKATANERASKKIRERNADVLTARQAWTGDIPRAHFTSVDFPR